MTLKAFCTVPLPLFSLLHLPILLTFQRNIQAGSRGGSWTDYRTEHMLLKDCSCVLPLSESLALFFHIFSFYT